MLRFTTEPAKRLPVSGEFDVIVVGGGIAGVAAAIAAARNGADVCLLEKEFGLGGLATLVNIIKYLPLCDGLGNQVIGGLGGGVAQAVGLRCGGGQPYARGGTCPRLLAAV